MPDAGPAHGPIEGIAVKEARTGDDIYLQYRMHELTTEGLNPWMAHHNP